MKSDLASKFLKKVGSVFRRNKAVVIDSTDLLELDASEDTEAVDGEILTLDPIDLSQFRKAADDRLREIWDGPAFDEPRDALAGEIIIHGDLDQREGDYASQGSMLALPAPAPILAGTSSADFDAILVDNDQGESLDEEREPKADLSFSSSSEEDASHEPALPIIDEKEEAGFPVDPVPVSKKLFRPDGSEMGQHRFGQYLVEKGLVTSTHLDAASREQAVTGDRIGQILVSNGLLSDSDRVKAILATSSERIAQENVTRSKIPVEVLEDMQIIISAETEDTLYVSTATDEARVLEIIREYYGLIDVKFVSYDPSRLAGFISQMQKTTNVVDTSSTKENMLNRILYRALGEAASDIHIMPRRKSYSIMFRILGVLRIVHEGPLDEYNTMLAQVKDKASMDLAEKRKAQDGGFNIEYAGKGIDFRVATNPIADGEKVVLRVLDPDRVQPSLGKLGITDVAKWRKGFNQQHGLCLICGPTGSGKTTTLNSSIKEINRFEKSIYTVEDPVEYRIPYVTQVSVNPAVGLTFAQAIRAFMRSDPDVIVLGEVRDEETARNMIKAADTGHLVLATLHTGSIVGAVSRLRDLGVPPRELRYLLRSVLVQTLVRTVCTECHGTGEGHEGGKCLKCHGTRYTGRTVVSECEYFEDPTEVDNIINATEQNVKRTWPTMVEDAVKKMRAGVTDEYELVRVFGAAVEPYLRGDKDIQEIYSS
ncbi:GspE/PulE family protein [Mesorhizobium sp. SP-1A]|uniref:GspE/PulE family protein n=1 Tax=Mesorhizobium sp. SP-1A TaxID=3077840 RepID=UPI0028F7104B|nr:ATPase, T2SS/T4P/T4SS family [Mesorhizobium sp. SP-1A]